MSAASSIIGAILIAIATSTAFAVGTAVPTENDPVAQSRAVKLTEQLRCLVCQNQSIAESNAELALDLRRQVREQIAAGKTDQEIIDYMVARYGDFVLYSPPLRPTTVLLWGGPALLLIAGLILLMRHIRGRRAIAEPAPLSEEERARAEQLLGAKAQESSR
ncbi:MAG TPA: cytochrome c-type biogenesis protein [Casimicrobiaceae bacterium]|nr:cytochrome c-type biogenesis protein [Casimicrobiaceae bacterium]